MCVYASFALDKDVVCLDNDPSPFFGPYQQDNQGIAMYYIVESNKSFEQAAIDLEAAVKRNDFGLLHIHDLGVTLRSKGIAFAENCKVFEVCNSRRRRYLCCAA